MKENSDGHHERVDGVPPLLARGVSAVVARIGAGALAEMAAVVAAWFAAVLLVTLLAGFICGILGFVPEGFPFVVRLGLVLGCFAMVIGAVYWTLLTIPKVYRYTYAACYAFCVADPDVHES